MSTKKIIVAGATGLVGKTLCNRLFQENYQVTIITRDVIAAKRTIPQASYVAWSDKKGVESIIDGSYGIINLAGAPIIGKRWTTAYKQILLDSRVKTTAQIIDAIQKAKIKPKVLINGSAIGFYGVVPSETVYDETAEAGEDFLAQVSEAWEFEAQKAEKLGVRVVRIRTAVVLDKTEGALPKLMQPFQFFVGGPIGTGKQWFPWIHVNDEVGIICFALNHEKVKGPINAAAPESVTNNTFTKTLGEILHKPGFFPIPAFVLKIIFGEASIVLTNGVAVSSKKITELGYVFVYPKLTKALEKILDKKE